MSDEFRAFQRDVLTWDDERFEQLVFAVVLERHPESEVDRTRAPDAGADVISRDVKGNVRVVWQAKHHKDGMHVAHCVSSLARIVDKRPTVKKVNFVFPNNLTYQEEQKFDREVRQLYSHVRVESIGFSRIYEWIKMSQDLDERFLRSLRASTSSGILDEVERTMLQGGRLRSGGDLVARLLDAHLAADSRDTEYSYELHVGQQPVRLAAPEALPAWTIVTGDEKRYVRIEATPRPEARTRPFFSFSSSAEGKSARDEARSRLAQGEVAVLTSGIEHEGPVPVLASDLAAEYGVPVAPAVILAPGGPVELEIVLARGSSESRYSFELRPVPPDAPRTAAFSSPFRGLRIELGLLGSPQDENVRTRHDAYFVPTDDVAANLAALEFLTDLARAQRATYRCPAVVPEVVIDRAGDLYMGELPPGEIEAWRDFCREVSFIETRTGERFSGHPSSFSSADLIAVAFTADALRRGEGHVRYYDHPLGPMLPGQIPAVEDFFNRPAEQQLHFMIQGRRVVLGIAEFTPPRLAARRVVHHGSLPTDPASIIIGPADERDRDAMHFRVVEWKRDPAA